ncbi:MAG: broad specificity phosphatase PhoE [Bacillariaceae sp.]|jgi:broad specificity phosphatase PhoE
MTIEQQSSSSSSSSSLSIGIIFSLLTLGALAGASLTFRILYSHNDDDDDDDDGDVENCCGNNTDEESSSYRCSCAIMKRNHLPELVILVRHGESEANVDNTVWWKKADHEIELTMKGQKQAADAGKRINDILNSYNNNNDNKRRIIRNIHLHVSPFQRTIQTARYARPYFDNQYNTNNSNNKNNEPTEKRIVKEYHLCTRLREQEFGNTQNSQFQLHREEQKKVGRFWYRFPTGESGADVLDRVQSWWEDTLLNTNERYGYEHCDAVIVFSHGLTVRLILCQLFAWSINTFHSVYNARNCDLYVLKKDLIERGRSPYILDGINGELPKSSIDICVTFHNQSRYYKENCNNNNSKINNNNNTENDGNEIEDHGNNETKTKESNNKEEEDDDEKAEIQIKTIQVVQKVYKLKDYLSMPSPRITRIDIAKKRLMEQYPNDFDTLDDIESIFFVPWCQYKHQK